MDDWNSWWNNWWVKALAYSTLAGAGGFLGAIMRSLDRSVPIHWVKAVVEGIAAGFVGLIVTLLCNATELSDQWTGVIVGVTGWLGANATIRILEKLVFKKLGIPGLTVPAPLDELPPQEKSRVQDPR